MEMEDMYDFGEEPLSWELEAIGLNVYNVIVNYDQWYIHRNFLFDYKARIIREYSHWLTNGCILTNDPFDNGVCFVIDHPEKPFQDQRYALMDFEGNILTDFFDRVSEGWVDDTYIAVEKDGKWGYIDKFGNQITTFQFDYTGWDYEWINGSSNYEKVRVYPSAAAESPDLGLFAFTGKLILEPVYKEIEIVSDFNFFENKKDRMTAFLTDIIYATDHEGNRFRWTHHHGLEKL